VDIEEFAPHMRPAGGFNDPTADKQFVEPGIAVGMDDAAEVRQMGLWAFALAAATRQRAARLGRRSIVGLWCKWRGPIGYADPLSWSRSAMSKLKIAEELFKGRHFERGIVILWVRWYLRLKLSLRDLVEMMAERGLSMAHTTIMRWVQR
jgi:hypothetical protein